MRAKLTAFLSILLLSLFAFVACEPDSETKIPTHYQKTGIVMSGAQETPPNASSALGTLDVTYIKGTKLLSYKYTWTGLADTITGIHIHGLAPVGYLAGIVQNILTTRNEAQYPFRGGSASGSLLVDGVVIKEENLLNGLYYLNIHTKTYPGGEIRGQIKFQ